MRLSSTLRVIWIAGGLALLLGLGRDSFPGRLPRPRELPRQDGGTGLPWVTGDFLPVPGIQEIVTGSLPPGIQQATTWRGEDEAQGRVETAWFRTSRPVLHAGVAGYPQRPGLRLWAEFRAADGAITRVDCPLDDPREEWTTWTISRPAGAAAVRLVAEDRSAEMYGWVAFSHPYRGSPTPPITVYQHAQVYTTVALALTLIWGPGLLLLRRPVPPELRAFVLLAAGPLTLAALGVGLWCAGGWVAPEILGRLLVTALWAGLGVAGERGGFDLPLSAPTRCALGVAALLVVAATAKSTYSAGPEGETYRGTISRNLAVGDRIDSRFPYYLVQIAAQHLAPGDPAAERYYHPWTFFSRGPLSGLTALPLVWATGGQPPVDLPDQAWAPFDREGFAAYRITLIVLAGGIILACFLMLAPLIGEPWALVASGLVALAPFGVHEVMFTWPKWIATAWIVTSFGLAHARRPWPAGVALGIGFLCHPLVLLWIPWLALWAAGRGGRNPGHLLATLARFAAGAGALVLPWMMLGRWMPHLPDAVFAGQGGFLRYWQLADSNLGSGAQWLHARWMNFANTFLPLHLPLSDYSFNHFRLNSAYEPSGTLVKFAFVWWNTLPFALGLGLWALSLAGLTRGWRTHRAAILLFVLGPAALLILYWGMDPLGLMRECGHPFFIAVIAILCTVAARDGGRLARVLAHRAIPWLQLPETLLMLWLTTLLNPRPPVVDQAWLDPAALTLNLIALGAMAWLLARQRATVPIPAIPSPAITTSPAAGPFRQFRPWLLMLTAGLLCYAATWPGRFVFSAAPRAEAQLEGAFKPDGHFPGEPLPYALNVRLWGSWAGSDANTGTLTLGPFVAPTVLRLALSGYPNRAGNEIHLVRPDTGARLPLKPATDIGERWRLEDFPLPEDWRGRSVQLVARDAAKMPGGWLALSEPMRGGHREGDAQLFASLSAWLLNGTLLGLLWYGALRWLRARAWVAPHWLPLVAAGAVAAGAYAVFWASWWGPVTGKILSGALIALGGYGALRRGPAAPTANLEWFAAPRLLVAVGVFYLAWLHLFPVPVDFHTLAAHRFRALPGDNTLPYNAARALWLGQPLKVPGADWLSSDRPPLQAGWLLLARPATALLDLDDRTAHGTAALWFESLWILAAYGLLRTLGLIRARALAWTALLAFSGFFILNTLFTWPKLSAAAFALAAFALWVVRDPPDQGTKGPKDQKTPSAANSPLVPSSLDPLVPVLLGAALAGLAWLAHGGVAFSFLALVPWLVRPALRAPRPWLLAAATFAVLALPWLAYQKFYDPPGNRLLKWHLGGQIDKEARGTWQTIREAYAALPARTIAANKLKNFVYQFEGGWHWRPDATPVGVKGRRDDEFFHSGRALTWWLLGFAALPVALWRRRKAVPWRRHLSLGLWTVATITLWCLLMFIPGSAMIHQGSYATMLALFVLLSAWCELASPWLLGVVAGLQATTFYHTWTAGNPRVDGPLDPTAALLAAVAAAVILVLVWREHRSPPAPPPRS